jgi:hypothetical protein
MRISLKKIKKVMIPADDDNGYVNIELLSEEELAEAKANSSTTSITSTGDFAIVINPYQEMP